ncbi:MarR family transcriptional regulator [Candidatus Gracilibacteria bacterium]|nr:MarR family transcriptional regulator [Candidatus Gracilibacteria bacterium]
MELLKSDNISEYIKPIADEVVYRLYDLYEGDIRSIMTGIRDILGQHSEKLTQPLNVSDAMLLLGKERWSRIEQGFKLTGEQKKVLLFLIENNEYISQKDVSNLLGIAQPNVSGYYFKPFKEAGIIEEKDKKGKEIFWGLSTDYVPLKWLTEEQKIAAKSIKEGTEQMGLFDSNQNS